MTQPTKCPKCGADWDGGSILETFIKQREEGVSVWQGKTDEQIEEYTKEFYTPPYRWGRCLAIYSQDTDRTEGWQCPDCEAIFKRQD